MKLLDCPLCGNNVISISTYILNECNYIKLECDICHLNISAIGLDDDNGRKVITDIWNKRFYPDDIKFDLELKRLSVKDKKIEIKKKEIELKNLSSSSNEKLDYIKWLLSLIESRDVTTEYDKLGIETHMMFKPTFSDLELLTLKDKLFVLLNDIKERK